MNEGDETVKTSEPALRLFCPEDIPAAMALKDFAGWNQTEEDWKLFLKLVPEGCFALEKEGNVIATSTAVPYSGFGWVGMMLVHPGERRKGYGTRTLVEAVAFLEGKGVVPALDATPMGRPLYEKHGFRELCNVERLIGKAPMEVRPHPACSRMDASNLGEALELDRESFGADRRSILEGLLGREGAAGFLFRAGGRCEGFILGRPGTRFFHLGPWVARSTVAAGGLLDTALAAVLDSVPGSVPGSGPGSVPGSVSGAPVGVDVLVPNAPARSLAERAGLPVVRTLVRMVKGTAGPARKTAPPGGRPDRIYGLAGLEWG